MTLGLAAAVALDVLLTDGFIECGQLPTLNLANKFIDFDDQIRAAASLLTEKTSAEWIRFKLDRRFDHVLVDEAQFLTRAQVEQLTDIADRLRIPVLCYGLRTDFQGNLFEGSQWLLAWADNLIELKTICHCGRKATMNLRVDAQGRGVREGAQVEIGGNERYVAMCRRHYKEALAPTPLA